MKNRDFTFHSIKLNPFTGCAIMLRLLAGSLPRLFLFVLVDHLGRGTPLLLLVVRIACKADRLVHRRDTTYELRVLLQCALVRSYYCLVVNAHLTKTVGLSVGGRRKVRIQLQALLVELAREGII